MNWPRRDPGVQDARKNKGRQQQRVQYILCIIQRQKVIHVFTIRFLTCLVCDVIGVPDAGPAA